MFLKIKNYIVKGMSTTLAAILLCPMGAVFANRDKEYIGEVQQCTKTRQEHICKYILPMHLAAVHRQLRIEIERYKNRAPDIFEIDDALINKADPKALLVALSTLNYLFDKYKTFTDKLIELKRKCEGDNKKFVLSVMDSCPVQTSAAFTWLDLTGMLFTGDTIKDYNKVMSEFQNARKQGFFIPCRPDMAFAATVAHEFGHLLSFICFASENGLPPISSTARQTIQLLTEQIYSIGSDFVPATLTPELYNTVEKCSKENAFVFHSIVESILNNFQTSQLRRQIDICPRTENLNRLCNMVEHYCELKDELDKTSKMRMEDLQKFLFTMFRILGVKDVNKLVNNYFSAILGLANLEPERQHGFIEKFIQIMEFIEKSPLPSGPEQSERVSSDKLLQDHSTNLKAILTAGVTDPSQLHISKYADLSSEEYAAETFSLLESGEPEKLKEPTENLQNFLRKKAHFLESRSFPRRLACSIQ